MFFKKKSLARDIFREIWRTKARFLSILIIIAVGVAFFAGIKATCPDMKHTAHTYYNDTNLMDLRFFSSIGFEDGDIDKIRENTIGTASIMPSKMIDVFLNTPDKNSISRIYGYDFGKIDSGDSLNKPILKSGRFPKTPNECVIDQKHFEFSEFEIGDKITFSTNDTVAPLTAKLSTDVYTIVGTVSSPMYISVERGNTEIGNGSINYFVFIPMASFIEDVYTDIFVTIEGAKALDPFLPEYKTKVAEYTEKNEPIILSILDERREKVASDATIELEDAKLKLLDGENTQIEELGKGTEEILKAENDLALGTSEYNEQLEVFNSKIADATLQIENAQTKLENGEAEFANAENLQTELGNIISVPPEPNADGALPKNVEELIAASAVFNKNLPALLRGYFLSKDATTKTALDQAMGGVSTYLSQTADTLYQGRETLNSQRSILADQKFEGEQKLADAKTKLDDGYKELANAKEEFDSAKIKSDEELSSAREKIADAEKEIADIPQSKVTTLDRNSNPAYSNYGDDSESIDAISQIFPLFFILVAALVCLTTMSRMVDEQRTEVGTLKALGYSKNSIISKYLIYAALSSVVGALVGIVIGLYLFPVIIFNAYKTLYDMPQIIMVFRWDYALWCCIVAVACTTLTAYVACRGQLISSPASLMRPKPPKSGKRVLLERIPFIWSKLNFHHKVTARNIFRYKNRLFMTIIGVAGCTALMLTGFGLKDSISSIVSKQFDEVLIYDSIIAMDGDADIAEKEYVKETIETMQLTKQSSYIYQETTSVSNDNMSIDVSSITVKNPAELNDYILLKERKTQTPISLQDDGVVINEKLASLLDAKVGDAILIDSDKKAAVVTGITENYVGNYIYMTPAYYEIVYGEQPSYNAIMANLNEVTSEAKDTMSRKLLENETVLAITHLSESITSFGDTISSLNYVVLVLILSAGALAFVVLYNLTNINVNERIRELATIKVLGFYDNEVSAYVYRESLISSVLGMLVGLVVGVFLHHFVVITAETNICMFGREIGVMSFVYSAVLTLAFTFVVNLVMHFKLKKINMIESLKSVE